MSESPKQLVLLSAYEELTLKEEVCIREVNMEATLSVQEKKAGLLQRIEELEKANPMRGEAKKTFQEKVKSLKVLEAKNAAILDEKMIANRSEYKSLIKKTGAASKVRNAYGISEKDRKSPSSLKDQA